MNSNMPSSCPVARTLYGVKCRSRFSNFSNRSINDTIWTTYKKKNIYVTKLVFPEHLSPNSWDRVCVFVKAHGQECVLVHHYTHVDRYPIASIHTEYKKKVLQEYQLVLAKIIPLLKYNFTGSTICCFKSKAQRMQCTFKYCWLWGHNPSDEHIWCQRWSYWLQKKHSINNCWR